MLNGSREQHPATWIVQPADSSGVGWNPDVQFLAKISLVCLFLSFLNM